MNETTTEQEKETRKWVEVASPEEIPEGEARTFDIGGVRVAVARAKEQLYAIQDLCSHDDGPLGEGELEEFAIVCPRHGAKFDVRTGAVLAMPAVAPIETFPVMEKDGKVMVGIRAEEDLPGDDDSW